MNEKDNITLDDILDFYGEMEEEDLDNFIEKWMPNFGHVFKEMVEEHKKEEVLE